LIELLRAQLVATWVATSAVEIAAAGLAVLYLVLAIRQRLACWAAAFISSCLYVWVLFRARLYMESALNAFYASMALYGYWQWTRGGAGRSLAVARWSWSRHVWGLALVTGLSVMSSFFLRRFTPAAWPFMDSLVTWASALATFLVARKIYENWYWWLVIDSVSLCLYFSRGLYLTMLLFALYIAMIFAGMREWSRHLTPVDHAADPA
jgi:nicotinamide mononucleotide transporter